jgi:alpha-glucosidase
VIANTGEDAVDLPAGELLVSSESFSDGMLPGDTTVWLRS